MCGICGVWGKDDRDAVPVMVAAMHHRGPDDSGTYFDESVSLGMTRLAILDTSMRGHQPVFSDDRQVVLIYNGELYNFREERQLLEARGHTFRSTSDTEVVLRMYEQYGVDFVKRMRGMFALAVYDKRPGPGRERLMLARDQMGIKPLLYAHVNGTLIFASEIKPLLASGLIATEIDPIALRLVLTYGSVYQPRTILKGVRMLLPAHRLIVEQGRERVERYWSLGLDRRAGMRQRPYESLVDEMAEVLEDSVRLQMVSDVPLGAFLSGGVDSSLLVALMARQVGETRVKTFSVGFEDEGQAIDETGDAERTARFIGTDHTRVVVTGNDVRNRITHIATALDQPSVDGVNSYFISLAARRAVTVAISGTGGDELFAGYPWFAQMVASENGFKGQPWKALARTMLAPAVRLAAFDSLAGGRVRGRLEQLRYSTDFRTRYAGTYNIFGGPGAVEVLAASLRGEAQAGRSAYYDLEAADELEDASCVDRVTGACLRGYTLNQLLRDIDAVSMSQSLEVRVPYLDPIVADAALSLPQQAKLADVSELPKRPEVSTYRETGAKRILLDIGKRLLPRDFDLQPKRGFSMPFESWLKGPLREVMLDMLSPQAVKRRGLLDETAVTSVKNKFLLGTGSWSQPWLLMMIELWCREVLDRSWNQDAHGAANIGGNVAGVELEMNSAMTLRC
jgi:asparagine synthase (glutamine-hydrolysing)